MNDIKEPILCAPNDPDDARLLSQVSGRKIDEVFIGSCMTNIGHFRAAGKLLNNFQGQLPTRLWIAPPTRMDESQLIEEGYYSTYGRVGARTEMPGCSLCMGNQARVAEKSTVVSTSTRNFPNRLGKGADVFLASAELAAVASIEGQLPTVDQYLKYAKEIDATAKDTFRYMNFDKMEVCLARPHLTLHTLTPALFLSACLSLSLPLSVCLSLSVSVFPSLQDYIAKGKGVELGPEYQGNYDKELARLKKL
jgi:aconitate hydratase 2 / 2-methylisocitrate dehydratase